MGKTEKVMDKTKDGLISKEEIYQWEYFKKDWPGSITTDIVLWMNIPQSTLLPLIYHRYQLKLKAVLILNRLCIMRIHPMELM